MTQPHKLNEEIFNEFADRLEAQLVFVGAEIDPNKPRRWAEWFGQVNFVTPHNRVAYRVEVSETAIRVSASLDSVDQHERRDATTYIRPPYDLTALTFILHEFVARIDRFLD